MTCHTLHAVNVGGGGGGVINGALVTICYSSSSLLHQLTTPSPLHGHLELFLLSGYIMCVCGGGVGRGGRVGGVCLIIQIQV